MAENRIHAWQNLLPAIYDLILTQTNKIVDDTSLEKLLELMEFANRNSDQQSLTNTVTIKFLNDMQLCQTASPAAVGFALRLAGMICTSSEGYNSLENSGKESTVLSSLFCKVLEEREELWLDAVVRDSYFRGASGVLDVSEGILWAQRSGCLKRSLKCFVDNSIFVAANARKFLAKYLILLHLSNQSFTGETKINLNNRHSGNKETFHCHRLRENSGTLNEENLTCVTCIVCHLKHLIEMPPRGLERAMSYQVSIAQLFLSLMEYDSLVSQDILTSCEIFHSCLQLLQCCNKDECGRVVDVVTTMMSNTRKWNINWDMLLNICALDTLHAMLETVFVLCRRSFLFLAFHFTQGLFSLSCASHLLDSWFCSLFTLITFPVHGSLHEGVTQDVNGHNCSPKDYCPKDAAKKLLSTTSSKEETYHLVESFVSASLKDFLSNAFVSHSLLVTTEVIKELQDLKTRSLPQFDYLVKNWAIDILSLPTRCSKNFQSGSNLLRQWVKALRLCIDLGLLRSQDGVVSENEKESFRLFLMLCSETLDSQALTGCLEGIKTSFLRADASSVSCYIQEKAPTVTLDTVLRRHCSHSCWDVKDSVLHFMKTLLEQLPAEKTKLFECFLVENRLLDIVWGLTKDIDSYVRASAIQMIGVISNSDILWKNFCHAIALLPEDVLRHVLDAFIEDEAAFPRRAVIELLTFWVGNKHELVSFMIRKEAFLPDELKPVQSVTLEPHVADALEKACQDFDWEVKICALNFWDTVIKYYGTIFSDGDGTIDSFKTSNGTNVVSLMGFDKVLFNALTDCDKAVRKRGFELLQLWQCTVLTNESAVHERFTQRVQSIEDLAECILKRTKENKSTLNELLATIDLSQLTMTFDDNDFFFDPLPFLEDILFSASDHDDNLLDCY